MTTVRAASSATPSEASAARKAVVVLQKVAHQEAAVREVVPRVAAVHVTEGIPHPVTLAVADVAPAVMRMTIIHRAAVAEVEEDSLVTKPTKLTKPIFNIMGG